MQDCCSEQFHNQWSTAGYCTNVNFLFWLNGLKFAEQIFCAFEQSEIHSDAEKRQADCILKLVGWDFALFHFVLQMSKCKIKQSTIPSKLLFVSNCMSQAMHVWSRKHWTQFHTQKLFALEPCKRCVQMTARLKFNNRSARDSGVNLDLVNLD